MVLERFYNIKLRLQNTLAALPRYCAIYAIIDNPLCARWSLAALRHH